MSCRHICIACSLIALAGCANSDADEFVATIIEETAVSATSSSYMLSNETYDVPWTAGDDISIFRDEADGSVTQKYSSLLETDQSSVQSNFRGNLFENDSELYYAIYPHYLTNSADYEAQTVSFDLAQSQSFDATSSLFATGLNVAVAQSETLGGFEFENVCGFLQVGLVGSGTIYTINVTTADGVPLWGRATVDMTSGALSIENSDTEGAKVVSLDCGESGIALSDAERLFTIVLPPISSTNKFIVTLNDETTPITSADELTGVDGATLVQGDVNYILDGNEVQIYSMSDFEGTLLATELQESTAWIIFSDNKTPTAEQMANVLNKAAEQGEDMVVSFLSVTDIPAGSGGSVSSSNTISLAFPKATTIGEGAFERWGDQITALSLMAAEEITLATDAFDGIDVANCSLLLDEAYNPYQHDMSICATWRDMEWGSINGNRKYPLGEFDSTSGKLADDSSPVGTIWWIDMPEDSTTSFDGLKAVLATTSGGVSLRFAGDIPSGADYSYALSGNSSIAEVDMSDFTTIPDSFLNASTVTKATLNKDITAIGNGAFYNCDSFYELAFSEGVREDQENGYSVGNSCFFQCSLITEMELKWATSVGNSAFTEVGKLQILKLPRATKFVTGDLGAGDGFMGSSNSLNEVYLTAEGNFTNISGVEIVSAEGKYINILGSVFARCMSNIHLYLHSSKKDPSGTIYSTQQHTQLAYMYGSASSYQWVWHVHSNSGNSPLPWCYISFIDDDGNVDGPY